MAALTVHVDVVSIGKKMFSGLAEMVIVTGILGEIGILPGHTALLTIIKPGPVRIIKPGNLEEILYASGGILEILQDKITVLADVAIRASDIDEAQAILVSKEAKRLLEKKSANINYSQTFSQLSQAVAQIRTFRMGKLGKHDKN